MIVITNGLHFSIILFEYKDYLKFFIKQTLYRPRVFDLLLFIGEYARCYGVDFFSIISRGSQYKVESVMLRILKPENFLVVSPTREQVRKSKASECIPLVMEPFSSLYTSPIVVLDFQSLYPSVMIAYNYWYIKFNVSFSTCMGRYQYIRNESITPHLKLGFLPYKISLESLDIIKNDFTGIFKMIVVAPNGVAFVKSNVREGILPKMLKELLETRIMVKNSMKKYPDNKVLVSLILAFTSYSGCKANES